MKLNEEAVSKAQQALFGIALSVKRGDKKLEDIPTENRDKIQEIVDSMTEKQINDYASTKTDGLPNKVTEAIKKGKMPYLRDVYESMDIGDKAMGIISRFIAKTVHDTGEIKDNVITMNSLIAPKGKEAILNFISDMGLFGRISDKLSGHSVVEITKDGGYSFDVHEDKSLDDIDWKLLNDKLRIKKDFIERIKSNLTKSDITNYVSTLLASAREMDDNVAKDLIKIQQYLLEEAGAATLDSTAGRGDFSFGNNPSDSSDKSKGSGEVFQDDKKQKTNEDDEFTLQDLEQHFNDNESDIRDRMVTYGYKTHHSVRKIRNYYDLATLLDVDSRLLKEIEIQTYAETLAELLSQD